jgi:hypothetical protein
MLKISIFPSSPFVPLDVIGLKKDLWNDRLEACL